MKYAGIYPGIDLLYHDAQGDLEYDFLVALGADPGLITLQFDTAAFRAETIQHPVRLDGNGDLLVPTGAGDVRFRKPVVYQLASDGAGHTGRQFVPGAYALAGENRVSVKVVSYDRTLPLVIDPVALIYSTYLGGAANDFGYGIAVDSNRDAYITQPRRLICCPKLPSPCCEAGSPSPGPSDRSPSALFRYLRFLCINGAKEPKPDCLGQKRDRELQIIEGLPGLTPLSPCISALSRTQSRHRLSRGDHLAIELRPLRLGELLDRTFSSYREHFWTFVGIMAPAEIVIVAVALPLQLLGIQSILNQEPRAVTPTQVFAAAGTFFGAISIAVFVSIFAHSIAVGATSVAMSKIHLGGRIGIADAYRGLRGSVARIIGLYGLYMLIAIVAFLAVVLGIVVVAGIAGGALGLAGIRGPAAGIVTALVMIPAMIAVMVFAAIVCMRYAAAVPALVLEKLGPAKALSRSATLTKGRLGQIFLACLLMYLICLVVASAIQTPFWVAGLLLGFKFGHSPFWLQAPATMAGGLGGAIAYPFIAIVLTLFYYDARVRKEGFDLQLMLSSIGPAPVAVPEPVAPSREQLPQTSVLLMIVLILITGGIYLPVWFLTRLRAFNRLNSSERLNRPVFIGILVLFAVSLALSLLTPVLGARRADTNSLSRVCDLAGGIALLIQAFKVRRILEEHVNAADGHMFAQRVSFSGVAVFFFGALYLQYKINSLIGVLNSGWAASPLAAPVLAPEIPPEPTTT